jgi:hypothetical protein
VKELEGDKRDKLIVSEERLIKKTVVLKTELKPKRGHSVFELNLTTAIIDYAEFKEEKTVILPNVNIFTGKEIGVTHKAVKDIIEKENCIYCTALNFLNADRRFHKMLNKPYKKVKT